MKLFLSSKSVPDNLQEQFKEFLGQDPSSVNAVVIENAADEYPKERLGFVDASRKQLEKTGIKLNYLDLREYIAESEKLEAEFKKYDLIWVGGGYVFYLRELFDRCGLTQILPKLIENGIMYGGESAGSVVVGPSLEAYQDADDITKAQTVITDGVGLTEFLIVPHWGVEKYAPVLEKVYDHHKDLRETIKITDEQAVVVENGETKII